MDLCWHHMEYGKHPRLPPAELYEGYVVSSNNCASADRKAGCFYHWTNRVCEAGQNFSDSMNKRRGPPF